MKVTPLDLPSCSVCFALKQNHPLGSARDECRALGYYSSAEGLLDCEAANKLPQAAFWALELLPDGNRVLA